MGGNGAAEDRARGHYRDKRLHHRLLEHARGGWMNVYYGNLELIDNAKAKWFAKVQKIYFPLQSFGRTFPFGGLPGREEPCGFCSMDAKGALYTVSNPSQALRRIRDGVYGICESTGQPIPNDRLDAVPWTRFARDEEAKLEREQEIRKPRHVF